MRINHTQVDRIKELFVGKSVTKVDDDILELNDGTKLRMVGNEGCGGCISGEYLLTELNECENIITNVEVDADPASDDMPIEYTGRYRLFVYAGHRRINLATFEGTDGNGYYGTGFWILVGEDAKDAY